MESQDLRAQLQHKIDFKTKPLGSLGMLESIALQIGNIQNSLNPRLINPSIIVFAGDHGIANEGVSAYPQEVTFQMVMNFLQGGAAINVFCKQQEIELMVVDAGVNYDFPQNISLQKAKISKGTKSFLGSKAMTKQELGLAMDKGKEIVQKVYKKGCNIIGFGEMGIGNTSSAAMIMSEITKLPLEDCVGKGTGLDLGGLRKKINVLMQAKAFHGSIPDAYSIMETYGGFEMAMMLGAMLGAFDNHMVVLIDGFIASAVFLVAFEINPDIKKNAIFCHLSDEFGHKNMLKYLEANPILNLNMRLGEGTGCAMAYPIIKSAVAFLNDMASFESAGISHKE